jgi:hypothetical protein
VNLEGVAGLWDKINEEFYPSASSTAFVAGESSPTKSIIAITGSGNSSYCYAIINGTKYSSATSNVEVTSGDIITFGVYGQGNNVEGIVEINGVDVLTVTDQTTKTYNWTVPNGVEAINISLAYMVTAQMRNGVIVVNTNLVSFTIADTSYQAESGMTWGDWLESSYNTAGYEVYSVNYVAMVGPISDVVCTDTSSDQYWVKTTDVIENGRTYYTRQD